MVIDFVVGKDAMVWPMVAAGTTNDDIKIARETAPDFEYEDGSDEDRTQRASPENEAHAVGAGREQAGRARPGRRHCSRRRGFNIDSLAVGPTEHATSRRMTIAVNVEDLPLEQVTKQLNKLINVLKMVELDGEASVQRELMLVKVEADSDQPVAGARDG